jgi:plastocyanin
MLRSRFRYFSIAVLALAAFALVACGDDNGDDPAPMEPAPTNGDEAPAPAGGLEGDPAQSLSITMADISFSETALTISAGELVEITLMNEGVLEHDFTIDSIPVEYEVTGAAHREDGWDVHADVPPGETGGVRMIVHEPGEYEFYCSVPGHREAGMVGTLTVQ